MNNTEKRNPKTMHIDTMTTMQMLEIINEEDAGVIKAVRAELPQIALAIDAIADCLNKGGRLFYIGAGTSGRLGVMDAAECPPTYGVSRDLVHAIIAGGQKTMTQASENEEDSRENG
ncbi:MAG: N-acetylmuramic acid 6-phosphate etherase, partial [Clostridia bacterium]|nr:N-acetylmuramic acid 6-phosphate etherase [Clostridia bacterium]